MTDFFEVDPEQQAERLRAAGSKALRHWGIAHPELELIKYRENAVFGVRYDGQRRALRIHRYGYHSDSQLRSELQWMQALGSAGIDVPVLVPAVSGEPFITHEEPGLPGPLQIDLFEWIDGEQLGSVEQGVTDENAVEHTYETIGSLAARVHNQASAWTPPAAFDRHAWDAEGLVGQQPLWGCFWEIEAASAAQRKLLERGRAAVYRDLQRQDRSPGVYSMIHADFAPENIMVDGDRVRLIDFDDCGFGWHLFELVTSLYFIMGEPYYERAKDAVLAGYRAHRSLPDAQLEALPLFFLARAFTYVGWVHTRKETETARELTPMLVEGACELTEAYLKSF